MTTAELTNDQKRSIDNYKRMGIDIDLLNDGKVKVSQNRLLNGYILNQRQLHERGREVFPDAKILPVVYSVDIDKIDIDWIQSKMKDLGINLDDLIKQLAIDKSTLNLFFIGSKKLDKGQKAAFFFYFLTYELNRDFRDH